MIKVFKEFKIKRVMNKRGISHVEVILSFILFLTFVGAALYFFSPTRADRLIDTSLDYAFREIKQNTTVDVDNYGVSIRGSTGSVLISGIGENTGDNKIVGVEDYDGRILPSNERSDGVVVNWDKKDYGNKEEIFAYVRFSEGIDGYEGIVDTNFGNSEFSIASSQTIKSISIKHIEGLKSSYENENGGYERLKENFNLPSRVDFSFSLKLPSGESIVAEREIPSTLDVYARTEKVNLIMKDGRIAIGELTVRIW